MTAGRVGAVVPPKPPEPLQWVRSSMTAGRSEPALEHKSLLKPGTVSVIDLSDSGMSELNRIVIADMLTGIQSA
jgi:hypothetical protein